MIPKIIHYCWFGGKMIPELAERCLESWKKYCPDYQIVRWDENNFDLNTNLYVREAFEAQKWAFVTDYVRLYVMYKFGGIYMDTDVELLANIDIFLQHKAFTGFEDENQIQTGIMASEKGNKWVEKLLLDYDERHFIIDGVMDLTTNVTAITNVTRANYNIILNNSFQDLGDVVVYQRDYFCPKDHNTGMLNFSSLNTVAIHHFNGSWISEEERELNNHTQFIKKKYGNKLAGIYYILVKAILLKKKAGIKVMFNYLKNKMFRN